MALNRPRDPLVFLNFLVDLLGSRLLPSMSVELPAGVAAWVLRNQLPAGGLVSAGSNILVALFCFLGYGLCVIVISSNWPHRRTAIFWLGGPG